MFMLLYGADYRRCTPRRCRSEKVSAAAEADSDFFAFQLTTKQRITRAINMLNKSIVNADYNGAIFMDG
jgi:hypothetical protein